MHFLSNKTVGVVVLTLLAIAGGWWIVGQNTPREPEESSSQDLVLGSVREQSGELIASLESQDRDGDGLHDWEEHLWGTDINNPDSDGDGTKDGDEVDQDRHPARPAPDDVLERGSDVTLEESIQEYLSDESRTETEKLAIEFFQGYARLRQTGGVGTIQETEFLNSIASQQAAAVDRTPYSLAQLNVATSETAEVAAAYEQAYATLFADIDSISENELAILEQALLSGSENDIAKLDEALAVYTSSLRQLLAMQVPQSVATTHLEVVNGFALLKAGVEDMRASFEDPVRGMVGVQLYLESTDTLSNALAELRTYFN